MDREFDIIVWGASGFTGRLVVDYMAANYAHSNLRWAVGGRDMAKIKQVLGARDVPVVIADSQDRDAIQALVERTRVVLTTVGPYARYGSTLVAACAQAGTHYCDLTGEVPWMRKMIDAHQIQAKDSGARIVHTCGFDSIPSDMGVYFLQQQMIAHHGVAAVQIKYRVRTFKGGVSGGTLDSLMAMMEQAKDDPQIFKSLGDPYSLNDSMRGLDGTDPMTGYFDKDFDQWVGPFVMAGVNTKVVRRSNELLDGLYGSDFRYGEGTLAGKGPGGFIGASKGGIGSGIFAGLAAFSTTRKLLQRLLPKPGEGPSEEQIANGYFVIEMLAIHPNDTSKNIRCLVKGDRDPGYGSTSKMISECALALAQDDLPDRAGFLTPASAMGDALLKRLPENAGVSFEIIS